MEKELDKEKESLTLEEVETMSEEELIRHMYEQRKKLQMSEEEIKKEQEEENAEVSEMSDSDWLGLASSCYSSSSGWLKTNEFKRWDTAYKLYNSKHYEAKYCDSSYTKLKSHKFIPKIHTFVKTAVAGVVQAYFSNKELINIEPYDDSDDKSIGSAKYYSEVLNYRLDRDIDWYAFVIGAYQDGLIINSIVSKVEWNALTDSPSISLIPIENFRVHPGCDWRDPIGSSPYLINMIPMQIGDIKKRSMIDGDARWNEVSDSEMAQYLDISNEMIRYSREDGNIDGKKSKTIEDDHTVVLVHENIINYEGNDYIFYSLGNVKMLSAVFRLEDVYLQGRPFVMGNLHKEPHKVYPTSIVFSAEPLQSLINDLFNKRIDNINHTLNPYTFVRKSSNIDINTLRRREPGSIINVNDPQKDINIIPIPDVTSSAFREQNTLSMFLDESLGSFTQSSASVNGANGTVGGMQMLSNSSSQVAEYYLRTFNETFIEPVLRLLLRVEQLYGFDNEVMMKMIFEKNKGLLKTLQSGIDKDFTNKDLLLNVNVGLGNTNPNMKLEKLAAAINTVANLSEKLPKEIKFDEIAKEVFSIMGYKNANRFLKLGQEEDKEKEMLKQQVQELQMKLMSKEAPELVQAKVGLINKQIEAVDADIANKMAEVGVKEANAKLKKMQSANVGVQAQFGAIQAAEVVAAIPEVAGPADVILKNTEYDSLVDGDASFNSLNNVVESNIDGVQNELGGNVGFIGTRPYPIFESNNNPNTPAKPESSLSGFNKGIETKKQDS